MRFKIQDYPEETQ